MGGGRDGVWGWEYHKGLNQENGGQDRVQGEGVQSEGHAVRWRERRNEREELGQRKIKWDEGGAE